MKRFLLIVPVFIFISFLSSCQEQKSDTPQEQTHGENLYYDCMENKIVINGNSTVEDNERGQWSVTFDGQLLCETEPINGADVNVKFPIRNTDLTIKTKDAGNFSVKLSRIEEDPRGKEFTVTLMGTKDKTINKTFKVE
jgi:hypothetical protein